jgi:hypothetical protein
MSVWLTSKALKLFLEHQFSRPPKLQLFLPVGSSLFRSRIWIPPISLNPLTSLITSRHNSGTTYICYQPGAKLGCSTSRSLSARISQSENGNRLPHMTKPTTEGWALQGFLSTEVYDKANRLVKHTAIRLLWLRLLIWRNYSWFFCRLHYVIQKKMWIKI